MDAPYCKLCKTKHWPREPHALTEASVSSVVADARKSKQKISFKPTKVENDQSPAAVLRREMAKPRKAMPSPRRRKAPQGMMRRPKVTEPKQRWDREKYNNWMRAYMKKRRALAKKKAKKKHG